MAKKTFWAARPFGYGEFPMLDVGQVIEVEVGQQRNDESLIRLGLFRELGGEKPVQCGKCGSKFLNERYLNQHGKGQHSMSAIDLGRSETPDADARTATEIERLRMLEAADEYAEKNVPLDLSKTKASKKLGRPASR
jgi:hypothetical protein